MVRPDLEALLQGALDDTLTPEERDTLRRLMAESVEVRGRAAHLEQLVEMLESLPPADAPPRLVQDVLSQISSSTRPVPVLKFNRPQTVPKRGVTVNKTMMFGLAAAAACVLAVITYTSKPPATEGTEATIGAAQRAQTPQIASKDVGLGDTSTQNMLQSETWDAIMKDEDLRSTLQDADVRRLLESADMREALSHADVREGIRQAEFAQLYKARLSGEARSAAEARSTNAKVNAAFSNEAFARALARVDKKLAGNLLNARVTQALASDAMARALRDKGFEAALRSENFARALARGAQARPQ
jgi:hypothetical protein